MCDCCIIWVFSIFFYFSQESAAESAASEENAASQKTDKTGKQVSLVYDNKSIVLKVCYTL